MFFFFLKIIDSTKAVSVYAKPTNIAKEVPITAGGPEPPKTFSGN